MLLYRNLQPFYTAPEGKIKARTTGLPPHYLRYKNRETIILHPVNISMWVLLFEEANGIYWLKIDDVMVLADVYGYDAATSVVCFKTPDNDIMKRVSLRNITGVYYANKINNN